MNLDQALKKYVTSERIHTTHTKIPNTNLNIFGNKYSISKDNEKNFYEIYQRHVFENNQEAYLTEKQLDIGKIAIDLDFRYEKSITSKQHTSEHIEDFILLLMNILNELFVSFNENVIHFYTFEKPNVNECEDKTKDGIHIVINILCDFATKMMIRDEMLNQIQDIWDDLPITNSWNDVIDEGVMKGNVNWQLYGSRKPGCEAYQLKNIYVCKITNDGEIDIKKKDPSKETFDFQALCIRSTENCFKFSLNDSFHSIYETKKKKFKYNKTTKSLKRKKNVNCSLDQTKNYEEIQEIVNEVMEDKDTDYLVKEVHEYTMALPEKFWGPGSYDNWIRVLWCLKNTHNLLINTWYLFCAQSSDFNFDVNDAIEYWNNCDIFNKEGLSYKSIIYWVKMYNFEEYMRIHKKTIDYYIYYSFRNNTEFDLATTLFHMFKSEYVCTSIKDNIWYEFKQNKWYPIDSGNTLRLKISTNMYNQYSKKLVEFQTMNQAKQHNIAITNTSSSSNEVVGEYKSNDNDFSEYKKKMNEMYSTCKLLKKTATKNNVMREAKELYYDGEFMNKLDKNSYLLGCNNFVIDFNEKTHRKGRHDDYISKSTGLNYIPLHVYKEKEPHLIDQVKDFMCQLFPDDVTYDKNNNEISRDCSLRDYMWEHLASTLLGTIENQTFNIYNGSGANGKSKLVEFMSVVLGEYKSTVPISLITQKRNNIGGTSSEVFNLIGTRYAVMQEPTRGDKINEGIMKELTGGDPIQCRALFSNSITFIPQFKLAVCTNEMPEINSNDDGTWRRIRKIEFKSKFTEKPYDDPRFPQKEYPHQFKVDSKIDEKFKIWAPVMLSLLVEIAYKTLGKVKDVKPVLSATDEYRQEQDKLLEFHNEHFDPTPSLSGYTVKERDLQKKFSKWWGSKEGIKTPTKKEVRIYFEKKYGKYPSKGWSNFSYKAEFATVEEAENLS